MKKSKGDHHIWWRPLAKECERVRAGARTRRIDEEEEKMALSLREAQHRKSSVFNKLSFNFVLFLCKIIAFGTIKSDCGPDLTRSLASSELTNQRVCLIEL